VFSGVRLVMKAGRLGDNMIDGAMARAAALFLLEKYRRVMVLVPFGWIHGN